jgi:uncharacterized protein YciI
MLQRMLVLTLVAVLCLPMLAQTPQENPNIPKDMRPYFVVFLVKGSNRDQPAAEAERIQNEHLAYIRKQYEAGKYLLSGPFMEDENIRGIIIVKAKSAAEARELVGADPAVRAGRLNVELHPAIFADLSCLSPTGKPQAGLK